MKDFPIPLNRAWWALRIGIGLGAFLAGLDKFFNLLTTWTMYLSPFAERMLPVDPVTFMKFVGVIEMVVGAAILMRWTREASYVAAAWLVLIAINLVASGMFFDLAVRDVEIAIAAFTLGTLTQLKQSGHSAVTEPGSERLTSRSAAA